MQKEHMLMRIKLISKKDREHHEATEADGTPICKAVRYHSRRRDSLVGRFRLIAGFILRRKSKLALISAIRLFGCQFVHIVSIALLRISEAIRCRSSLA